MSARVYLDWNATAPLRPEARAAMLAAMDVVGNPSSVHAEGRAARAVIERARAQVAALAGCAPEELVFTSGATEANAMALRGASQALCAATEHESVFAAARAGGLAMEALPVDAEGRVAAAPATPSDAVVAVAPANGETGALTPPRDFGPRRHADATQAVGRGAFRFDRSSAATAAFSAHKLGGPKGVGALLHRAGAAPAPLVPGGGQEGGWRGGTENVIGIAGFGAAAEAARRDVEDGVWERVENLRDTLEERISERSPRTIFIGRGAPRLPNTSCFATPGWPGETQVIQLDLAGFAVSAGAACSSGKARASHALTAMGHDEDTVRSAVRVSLGPTTMEDEIHRFCDAWIGLCEKRRPQAA